MKHKLTLVIGGLALALLLTACGGESPAATTAPQAPAENTETTEVSVAPTLSETYTSEDGKWTFQYPSGWVVTTPINNIILITTSEATANKTFSTAAFDSGEAAVQLGLNTINASNSDPSTHVQNFAGSIGIPLEESTATTITDRQAGRVDGKNDARHLMVVSQVFGGTYVDAVTYTNPGEFAQMESTLLAIIESVTYSAE